VDAVHERIARIGHKLISEAFMAPSIQRGTSYFGAKTDELQL
jgi:hypothetical protein